MAKSNRPYSAAAAFFCEASSLWKNAKTKEEKLDAFRLCRAAMEVSDNAELVAGLQSYNETASNEEVADDIDEEAMEIAADEADEDCEDCDDEESEDEEASDALAEDEETEDDKAENGKRKLALTKALKSKRVQANLNKFKGK